jgi:tRNA(fMet)-specific endonuclease VapC
MKRIILDTNAFVKYLQGDEKVPGALTEAQTEYCSVMVIGELLAGFKGGNRELENRQCPEGSKKNQR